MAFKNQDGVAAALGRGRRERRGHASVAGKESFSRPMFPSRSIFCRVYFGMNPGSQAGGSPGSGWIRVKAMRHVRVT